MESYNVFDEQKKTDLTPEEQAEVERYVEQFKEMQREDAAREAQKLARKLMALSRMLSDDDRSTGRNPFATTESTRETVKANAEFIHRRITEARHGS